jgi:hypothetical protein
MTAYFTLNTVSEFLCFLISLFCLFRDTNGIWRSFMLFLLLTCLVEVAGIYIRHDLHKPNVILYNIFLVVECVVLNYFFYNLMHTGQLLKKGLIGWLLFFGLFFIGELTLKGFHAYVSATSTLLSVELIFASVYFYYLLLKEEKPRALSRYASFWWVNGTICFYFAGIACNLFFDYMLQVKNSGAALSARYIVFSILNVILYSSWSYSFICRYRQRKSAFFSE